MIVEKQVECRLAGETEVLGETLAQHHFCPSQNATLLLLLLLLLFTFNCKWVFTRWQQHNNRTKQTSNTHHTK
jgi:hypothetical protein